jgi:hypothetical protein
MTSEHPKLMPNTFQEVLLGFEYTSRQGRQVDLFSLACVKQMSDFNSERLGYLLGQVFERHVLEEVATLDGVDLASVADMRYRPTATMTRVAQLTENAESLPVIGMINLATALVSVSRFDRAARILRAALLRATTPRDVFEIAMLEFIVSNRRDNGAASPRAFGRMRKMIETGVLPHHRVMDACTQAVVWYMKNRQISESDFHWYVATGRTLVEKPDRLDPGSISAWYRAIAMIPAAKGDAPTTRHLMQQACDAAQRTLARRSSAYEMQLMKTYHESSLKEHMYVTRDVEKAEAAGRALIAVDTAWSPSYGELADAYLKFGLHAKAAALYEQAAEIGPPYFGHHAFRAAQCHEALDDTERALSLYVKLAKLSPNNKSVVLAGLKAARRISHQAREEFEFAFNRLKRQWEPADLAWLEA